MAQKNKISKQFYYTVIWTSKDWSPVKGEMNAKSPLKTGEVSRPVYLCCLILILASPSYVLGQKKYGHKSGCPLQGSTDHWKCQIWILMQSPFSASGEVGRVCAMTILDLAVKASEKLEVKVGRVSFSLCFVKKCPNWSSCWTKKSERLKVRGENFFPFTFVFRLISSFYRS